MHISGEWLVAAILGAEVAFWVLLGLGLVSRYLLKWQRLSTMFLLGVPLADLVLILLVGIDLSNGAEPTAIHGLAAVYLGFSVGYGHYLINRADQWFAHRFADGPKPERVPATGPERVKHEWQSWLRILLSWAIAVAALMVMKAFSGWSVPSSSEGMWSDEIWAWVARVTIVNVVWFLTGPVYSILFQSRSIPEAPEPQTKESAYPSQATPSGPAPGASTSARWLSSSSSASS